jgi:hypothetical protein
MGFASLVLGVLLPFGAIVFELVTGMCAELVFDPLPTPFHVVLVTLVPAFNLMAWLSFRRDNPRPRLLAFCNGAAIGIASFYSVLFLPVLPLSVIGIVVYGLGLLPWTPVFALITAILLRRRLREIAAEQHRKYVMWPGLVCGLLALLAVDLPTTLTQVGLRMATASTQSAQARGIRMLRAVGNEDLLLRYCYVRTGVTTDLLSFVADMNSVSPDQVRKVYYRVTGAPFNSMPAPENTSGNRGDWRSSLAFDRDQGTDTVGGRLPGLTLASSRLDGSLDANAALGYFEWILVLKNDANITREARAQIALPPGAVVSRLTLWVNGEEREAAFAARGQVTAAYRSVVRQQRDPVLVTTAGADRIAVQMFPVPVHGEMKVRIGITAPLQLDHLREGRLQLPYFHERNFDVPMELRHSLWFESKAPLNSALGESQRIAPGAHSLRLQATDAQLSAHDSMIIVPRGNSDDAWSHDVAPSTALIKQTLQIVPIARPSRLVLVVDSSVSMANAAPSIADAIATLPSSTELFLILADDGDSLDDLVEKTNPQAAATQIRARDFVGGVDNTSALARGLDLVLAKPDSALIWIHGPQPVQLQTAEALEQRLIRGGGVRWYDVQVTPGANLIGERINELQRVRTLSYHALPRLFASWRVNSQEVVAFRERVDSPTANLPVGIETSAHLARLWAHDEVGRLIYGARPSREAAIDLAHRYQLVTPVTGAVVLETQQQYDAAGLTPVPEGTVPTIPEPEEWALMAIALAILLYSYRRRRVSNYAAI